MSHCLSDPEAIPQFRRRWGERPLGIKFLSEMSQSELDRLGIACGERIVRGLPVWLTAAMNPEERRELARAFGRPLVRAAQQRRDREKCRRPQRN